MKKMHRLAMIAGVVLLCGRTVLGQAAELAPYGTAKEDMHAYPTINRVYDVNYTDPTQLNALYYFIKNVNKVVPGKTVVVTHGPELRVFAKENYLKYQSIVDKMAELSREGVEFHMCHNAMHAAGFKSSDMDGFVTVIPAGFAEIVYYENKGYQLIEPVVTPVKDSRYLDHPEEKH